MLKLVKISADTVRTELERAKRSSGEVSLILVKFEQDHTKHFKRIGQHARASIRGSDAVGWIDRGNLALLLPDTHSDGARQLLDRLNDRIRLTDLPYRSRIINYPQTLDFEKVVAEYFGGNGPDLDYA